MSYVCVCLMNLSINKIEINSSDKHKHMTFMIDQIKFEHVQI